ncbi:sulfotransferase [Donghicola sp. C2-DW-16]|uniref:Sulfotransferase n=1 Tax=Donghicola mangrovi TaxID=2729614 RepID=A0ABX2PIA7_9RHOB|nr:sulfotransferase [Donghicola mangrovi]NVO29184.1 sulfotransferase [Donghicola mangrovi]
MQYVFVITYGRSGSTVLMRLLNMIDGWCIRGENMGALNLMALVSARLRSAQAESSANSGRVTHPWYGIGDVNPSAVGSALSSLFEHEFLRPDEDTRVTGFKEIRFTPDHVSDQDYTDIIHFMAEEFPNSRFIFNTRSWREVARSGWWRFRVDLGNVRKCIEAADARFKDSSRELGTRAFCIDYADYKDNPEGFRPLLSWLGEELSPSQLSAVLETKLKHLAFKEDERGRLLRLRRAFYWRIVDRIVG